MKILIIMLVTAEFFLTLYTYAQIRDICGHINDTLTMQDIQLAKMHYKIDSCDVATSENSDKQENKKC